MWSDICDTYIEMIKPRLYNENMAGYKEAVATLNYVLVNTLKLLHPYMPFITEEIYLNLKHDAESIMISKWPESIKEYDFEEDKKLIDEELECIRQIRNIRAEANVPNSKKTNAVIVSNKYFDKIELSKEMITKMAYMQDVKILPECDNEEVKDMTAVHTQNVDMYIDMSTVIDKEQGKTKLLEEKKKIESELARANKMLSNEAFVAKAPQKLIDGEKEKVAKYTELLEKVEESLAKFN